MVRKYSLLAGHLPFPAGWPLNRGSMQVSSHLFDLNSDRNPNVKFSQGKYMSLELQSDSCKWKLDLVHQINVPTLC